MDKTVFIKGTVSEMARRLEGLKIEVPFAEGVDIKSLTKGDKSPMFVTVEAVNDTISKGNRRYTPEVIKEISKQINLIKPDGYEGHLKDEERPYARPKSQTLWLGSTVKEVDGKIRLFVKGYVFPYAKELKQYLKAAKATGKSVAVSIYGQAKHIWNTTLKAYDLTEFNLESIDWARSGSEGIPAMGYLGIASEMKGKKNQEVEAYMKPTTLNELREESPQLFAEMEDEIRKKIVKEMKDNENQTIAEMVSEINSLKKEQIGNYVETKLKERVVSENARKVIKSIIVREIGSETNLDIVAEKINDILKQEDIKTIVREMSVKRVSINPQKDNRKSIDTRKFTVIK